MSDHFDPADIVIGPDIEPGTLIAEYTRRRPDWFNSAACRGVGTPTMYGATSLEVSEALAVCSACPVLLPCREWCLGPDDPLGQHGVGGGMTPNARRIARKARTKENCHFTP